MSDPQHMTVNREELRQYAIGRRVSELAFGETTTQKFSIKTLLSNISQELYKRNKSIASCHVYPGPRCDAVAPAVFLEAASYSAGDDPATSELALIVNIEARVVIDSVDADAELNCQSLACDIARIAHLNSFGCPVSPAKVNSVTRDAFKPEFDAYICWLVEWSHEFHLGESVWLDPGITPHVLRIEKGVVNG